MSRLPLEVHTVLYEKTTRSYLIDEHEGLSPSLYEMVFSIQQLIVAKDIVYLISLTTTRVGQDFKLVKVIVENLMPKDKTVIKLGRFKTLQFIPSYFHGDLASLLSFIPGIIERDLYPFFCITN